MAVVLVAAAAVAVSSSLSVFSFFTDTEMVCVYSPRVVLGANSCAKQADQASVGTVSEQGALPDEFNFDFKARCGICTGAFRLYFWDLQAPLLIRRSTGKRANYDSSHVKDE